VECSLTTGLSGLKCSQDFPKTGRWSLFLKSPERFQVPFGWQILFLSVKQSCLEGQNFEVVLIFFPLQHMKRLALQNKWVGVLQMAFQAWKVLRTFKKHATLLAEPSLTVHILRTEKRLCMNPVKFLLSMLSALLSNSFEPRPNRCSFLTVSFRRTFRRHFYLLPAGSVSIIGFSQKLMLALEKQVWRE